MKTKLLGVALLQKYVRTLIYFLCLYSELTEETVHASENYVGDLIMDTGHDHGHLHLNVLHEGHHHTTTGKLHMACAWASISAFNTIHTRDHSPQMSYSCLETHVLLSRYYLQAFFK